MRSILLALLALAPALHAETLEEKLDATLAKAFVKNAAWVLDYSRALEAAKKTDKLVFGYFTRSYMT